MLYNYSSWGDILTWFLRIEFVMDDEKLVEAMHSFPSLWKVISKSYKDLYIRQKKTPGKKWIEW